MGADFLRIHNLHVRTGDKPILKGLDLTVGRGEVHVIMGPNGAGKSTLANVLMGHPQYEISEGTIEFLRPDPQRPQAPRTGKKLVCFYLFSIQKRFPALRWRPS